MTTIGFGDYYPRTMPGRILTFALACFGVAMTSLMVVALSNYITLNKTQKKAFFMIKLVEAKKQKFESASKLIVQTMKSLNYFRGRKEGWVKKFFMGSRIDSIREKFAEYRQKKRAIYDVSTNYPMADLCIMQNDQLKVRVQNVRNS